MRGGARESALLSPSPGATVTPQEWSSTLATTLGSIAAPTTSSTGLDHHRLRREFGVIGAPLVQASARFRSPATFGDILTATSWIAAVGRRSFTVRHELVVDARLVVEGEETRVWGIGRADDPKQLRAETIPSEIRALLLGSEAAHATEPGDAP